MSYLRVKMKLQEGERWCWAAVAECISQYYSHSSEWTQCKIAKALWKKMGKYRPTYDSCCKEELSYKCDMDASLEVALGCTNNYDSTLPIEMSPSGKFPFEMFKKIVEQIKKKHPVAARIETDNTDKKDHGHFLVICGYEGYDENVDDLKNCYFVVADSLYGTDDYYENINENESDYVSRDLIPVSKFYPDVENPDGWWTDLYFTKGG